MLFNIVGRFRPGAAAETKATAEAFNDHLEQLALRIPLAGRLCDAQGRAVGFMVVVEAPSFAEAERFAKDSPNLTLYDRVEVAALDVEVGSLS